MCEFADSTYSGNYDIKDYKSPDCVEAQTDQGVAVCSTYSIIILIERENCDCLNCAEVLTDTCFAVQIQILKTMHGLSWEPLCEPKFYVFLY